MTKKHFLYLSSGILFWGILVGIFAEGFLFKDTTPLSLILFLYILLTILVCLMVMKALDGFPLQNPKNWFFYPIFSWLAIAVWYLVEKLFGA